MPHNPRENLIQVRVMMSKGANNGKGGRFVIILDSYHSIANGLYIS